MLQVWRGYLPKDFIVPKSPERILFCGWRRDMEDMIMVTLWRIHNDFAHTTWMQFWCCTIWWIGRHPRINFGVFIFFYNGGYTSPGVPILWLLSSWGIFFFLQWWVFVCWCTNTVAFGFCLLFPPPHPLLLFNINIIIIHHHHYCCYYCDSVCSSLSS